MESLLPSPFSLGVDFRDGSRASKSATGGGARVSSRYDPRWLVAQRRINPSIFVPPYYKTTPLCSLPPSTHFSLQRLVADTKNIMFVVCRCKVVAAASRTAFMIATSVQSASQLISIHLVVAVRTAILRHSNPSNVRSEFLLVYGDDYLFISHA